MKNPGIKINVISTVTDIFEKQLSPAWKEAGYEFSFNSRADIVWDAVVVYENLREQYDLKYKAGGLFFLSGEPPIVKVYSQKFIDLFDHVISAHTLDHPRNHRDQQALPWYFGYNFRNGAPSFDFRQIEEMEIPRKTKKISFITSNRTFLPGHKQRLRWMNLVQREFGSEIDFYGKGIKEVDDKAQALCTYEFSICIENSYVNDYWTEKIADPLLAYTVPVYAGCKNIREYFPERSFIPLDIKDIKGSLGQIEEILERGDEIYRERLPYLQEARKKLLYEYNLFPFIKTYLDKYVDLRTEEIVEKTIRPYDSYPKNRMGEALLKTKRILRKIVQ